MPLFRICAFDKATLIKTVKSTIQAIDNQSFVSEPNFDQAPYCISLYFNDHASLRQSLIDIDVTKVGAKASSWCLMFTGQGSQYPMMGASLSKELPLYNDNISETFTLFNDFGTSIDRFFTNDDIDIHQTQYTQMCIVTLQLALANFWRSIGLPISSAIGHSIGELSACIDAGFYTKPNGLKLVYERATRMQSIHAPGSMFALRADLTTTQALIHTFESQAGGTVAIAGINSPSQTIISGNKETLANFITFSKTHSLKSVPLVVSHAFHSPLMNPMIRGFVQALDFLSPPSPPHHTIYSNLDCQPITIENLHANYWAKQLVSPVNFVGCADKAWQDGERYFLEIGPHPVLCGLIGKTLHDRPHIALYSMHKKQQAIDSLLQCVCNIDTYYTPLHLKTIFNPDNNL